MSQHSMLFYCLLWQTTVAATGLMHLLLWRMTRHWLHAVKFQPELCGNDRLTCSGTGMFRKVVQLRSRCRRASRLRHRVLTKGVSNEDRRRENRRFGTEEGGLWCGVMTKGSGEAS